MAMTSAQRQKLCRVRRKKELEQALHYQGLLQSATERKWHWNSNHSGKWDPNREHDLKTAFEAHYALLQKMIEADKQLHSFAIAAREQLFKTDSEFKRAVKTWVPAWSDKDLSALLKGKFKRHVCPR